MQVHGVAQERKRTRDLVCPRGCGKSYSSEGSLRNHLRIKHSNYNQGQPGNNSEGAPNSPDASGNQTPAEAGGKVGKAPKGGQGRGKKAIATVRLIPYQHPRTPKAGSAPGTPQMGSPVPTQPCSPIGAQVQGPIEPANYLPSSHIQTPASPHSSENSNGYPAPQRKIPLPQQQMYPPGPPNPAYFQPPQRGYDQPTALYQQDQSDRFSYSNPTPATYSDVNVQPISQTHGWHYYETNGQQMQRPPQNSNFHEQQAHPMGCPCMQCQQRNFRPHDSNRNTPQHPDRFHSPPIQRQEPPKKLWNPFSDVIEAKDRVGRSYSDTSIQATARRSLHEGGFVQDTRAYEPPRPAAPPVSQGEEYRGMDHVTYGAYQGPEYAPTYSATQESYPPGHPYALPMASY